ncbi:MAG TPA: TolC family protein [Pyrinomonadaceae bacterium]|nr:TolC family protein [Pyrinomonadaceae bacterium]
MTVALVMISASGALGQQPSPAQRTPPAQPAQSPQTGPTPRPSQTPQPTPTPQQTPSPRPTPQMTPLPSLTPSTASPQPTPSPSATPSTSAPPPTASQTVNQAASPLSLDEALRLAGAQASAFQQAGLNERIAAEDVRQAQAAFLPRVTAPLDYIYTSPAFGLPSGQPRVQSFIANNAIGEYQALVSVNGDIDIAGKLRATLQRNRALLAAAHAGTEVSRRALNQATVEAYYGLALATARRRTAEQNLSAAEEFERNTALLLSGGEVAPVDVTRAQLQTTQRRGELEQALADEALAADALRVLVGYDFAQPIQTTDLATGVPTDGEIERMTTDTISQRPEFAQFEAERRAAELDVKIARADRLPTLSYTINGGFDTDSLKPMRLKEHIGASGAVHVSIPLFDFGANKSRERQARLRAQVAESQRAQALKGFYQQFYAARVASLSAARRIRLAGTGIAQAESNLLSSIARYRAGEATIIEVTDAQTTLAAQRFALFQAIFDYQTARARLLQAAGR